MAIAYHMETLRKQRVLDRKSDALGRITLHQGELERTREDQFERRRRISFEQDQVNAKERDYYLKNMGRMDNSENNGHTQGKYIDMIKERQHGINRNDLRHQARELRDNCLYMGPVNEYFMA